MKLANIIFLILLVPLIAMSSEKNKVKYLKDYKKPDFLSKSIYLTIDLFDNETLVTNEMVISKNTWATKDSPLHLDGNELELVSISLNDKLLQKEDYKISAAGIEIEKLPENFKIKIINKIYPQKNTSLEGLYLAGETFLTQCEPNGFSNITYSLDRPDVMTVFTTKIIADKKYPTLLSNGDKTEEGLLPNNRHFVVFHDESKKPTYLFAAVIGDLSKIEDSFVTKSGKKVDLQIYSDKKDLEKLDYAMYSLKSSMKWDEEKFGREYDLKTYMIVATSYFNSGAMENKGLNIFNTRYVLANKDISSDTDFMNVYSVIGHEYFHNWTGNRITLANWFELSLKEGLTVYRDQEFSADSFSRSISRIDDANLIRSIQFAEDNGPLSHPVKPASYIKMDNFYTVTVYDKGAELIRMIHTILGEKLFKEGMDIYFNKYDGMAVTTEEFIRSFEEASKIDFTQFKLWYSQNGTPNIKAKGEYDKKNKIYTLNFEQVLSDKKPFHIPVKLGFIGKETGNNLNFKFEGKKVNEIVINIKDKKNEFVFEELTEEPVPSLFRDFSAPVKIEFNYSDEDLLLLSENDDNLFNKWDAFGKYKLKYLLELNNLIINHKELKAPKELVTIYKKLLNDKNTDKAFIARMIALPNEKLIREELNEFDPITIYESGKFLASYLANELKDDLLKIHQELAHQLSQKPYNLNNTDIAARSLKNVILSLLSYGNKNQTEKLALKSLKTSDNFTDRIAALIILADSTNDEIYKEVNDRFYQIWKEEDLVIYNWLSVIAGSERNDVYEKLTAIMKHKAFDIKVPNKVLSVIRGFANNTLFFHDINGKGYKWLADITIEVDKINPKTSSRIVQIFNNWKKFEKIRKNLIKLELERITKNKNISDNLREMVEKILQG